MDSKSNIFAALVQAQAIAKAVLKDSRNDFHKYKYASAEDMIAEARDALSSAGLAFFPVDHRLISATVEAEEDKVQVDYLLVHGSGESHPVKSETPVMPEKGRPLDKALATALTYNLGYTLRGLLLLPRVEKDAQVDGRDDRNHTPRREQVRAQPKVDARAAAERVSEDRAADEHIARVEAQKAALKEELAAFQTLFGAEAYRVVLGGKRPENTVESLQDALAKCQKAHAMRTDQQIFESKGAGAADGPLTPQPPPKAAPAPLRAVEPEAAENSAPRPHPRAPAGREVNEQRKVSAAMLAGMVSRAKYNAVTLAAAILECFGEDKALHHLDASQRLRFAEHIEGTIEGVAS